MKNKTEKKAKLLFALLMVGSLLVGGCIGALIVFMEGDWTKALKSGLAAGLRAAAPWALLALALISGGTTWVLYRKGKAKWNSLADKEDSEAIEAIDQLLSPAMWVISVCLILSYFFVGVPMTSIPEMDGLALALSLAAFLLNLAVMFVGQKKIIDLTKAMNPEKQGSVYDTKFNKVWYESCDERERSIICQAAYAAYQAMSNTCLILWLLLVLGDLLFDLGFLPIAVVTIIWLVGTLRYYAKAAKLEKAK